MPHIPENTRPERPDCSRPRRAALLTVGVLTIGASVAACGGPSTPGVASRSTTTTVDSNARGSTRGTGLAAYSSCMRSHGVPSFPDPSASGGIDNKRAVVVAAQQVGNARFEAASKGCAYLLPPGGSLSGHPNPTITPQQQQDYLNAAACMRSHGITNFPDPSFPDGHVSLSIPPSINTHSTQFTQAAQTCTRLIPSGLPYSAGHGG